MKQFVFLILAITALNGYIANAQWSQLPGKGAHWCLAVYATSDAIIAATQDSNIIRSTDLGETWVSSSEGINDSIYTFTMYGEGHDVYLGSNKGGYTSTNGGLTWDKISTGPPTPMNVYAFYRFGTRLFMGTDSGVFRSLDNGKHWEAVNTGFPGLITVRSFAADDNYLYAGTRRHALYRSMDNGDHWEKVSSNLPDVATFRTLWIEGQYMMGFDGPGGLYRSTDGGTTWVIGERFSVSATAGFCAYTIGDMLVVGTDAGIWASTDNGATWNDLNQGMDPGANIYSISIADGYVYAGSSGDWIWRRPLAELVLPASAEGAAAPYVLHLGQNTPNPATSLTEIPYRLSVSGRVTLKLYDGLMQEVSTLIDEWQDAGLHRGLVDASRLPVGVYYYRLTSGTSSVIRRMVVVR